MKAHSKLLALTGSLLMLYGCSSSATADEQPEVAGDSWVNSEIRELDSKVTEAEARTEQLSQDIAMISEGRSFIDVDVQHNAFHEIEYLTSLGIINGYSDQTFRPSNSINRGQTAAMIARHLSLTVPDDYVLQAPDVSKSHQNYDDLRKVEYHGVMTGNNDGHMNPSNPLTRSQMAVVLVRAFPDEIPETSNQYTYTDLREGSFSYDQVNQLADAGITNRVGTAFRPSEHTTRSHFALFMSRTINEDYR
ncbi:S-layer homology domain-containing protein [Geomicrobium sediminis]|uniref:Outer membrane murein-binding lipoprotein Lpp n=1 Tax=Geomicrobium sediminis TaxID=1347788 RepID=A0ABS2P7B5_9BACL|nr:S-layer homology domain-containing protein [Geomicrobium sediminis]MBM7631308.1 outer membrane murein-binding lipoprotein Lpp [Geomicrobium sediminis]